MMLTALIVDDEPLARAHLRHLMDHNDIHIVGEAETADQALRLTEDLHPDLVFLDIQMRGLTGMQAASAFLDMDPPPLLIFVTGYSEYAVDAFQQDALDYLLKPVSSNRLAQTLVRARERLADVKWRRQTKERIAERASNAPPLRRLPVRKDYEVHLIRVEEIVCAIAREKRVFVRTQEDEYRTYYTLTLLEALLPKEQFLRIHDSYLVNLEMVQTLLFLGGDSHAVKLLNGLQIPVGRKYYPEFQQRVGLNVMPS